MKKGASRDERVIQLLVAGWAIDDVATLVGCCEKTVRNARDRMLAKAERDIQMARLKLWRESARAA